MTVEELLTRMSSHELSEWMAYLAVEPFGEERADYRAAIGHALLANINRGKRSKTYTPEDFMPRFGRKARKGQTVEEQLAQVRQIQAQHDQKGPAKSTLVRKD